MRRVAPFVLAVASLTWLVALPAEATTCSNDLFDSPIVITVLDHSDECDTTAADTEAGEPGPSCAAGLGFDRTVWWKYVPTVATETHIKANTFFSSFNTLVALYEQTGSGFGGLVELACNNDVALNKDSRVTQALQLGHTYYFQVGGVSVAGGTLKFRVKKRLWKVGVTRGDDWFFNGGFDGTTEFSIEYGASSDTKLAGSWGGHGVDTPWVRRGNLWIANDWFDSAFATQFHYGRSSDVALLGDWNRDEILTPVVRRANTWLFNNGLDGAHELSAVYGKATDLPLVGDWDGDGVWTPGVRRGNVWYLNNGFDGAHDITAFSYGRSGDLPVVGDWDGDGTMTPGVVRGNVWYLSNGFDGDQDVATFAWGRSTDGKISGDWNGIVE